MKQPKLDHWKAAAKVEWTVEDWATFYHAINRALRKIAKRHSVPDSGTSVSSAPSC